MTCAACAARVERRLNRLDGVEATVSLATEQAHVRYDPDRLAPADLLRAVEEAGYTASLDAPVERQDEGVRRLLVAAALSVPVVAVSMVPALQFDYWGWAALVLATAVVWWCGWPFHHAALVALRRRELTMDTLVSMGSAVAWGWSAVALAALGAGSADVRMDLHLRSADSAHGDLYFEVACGVVALLLVGRWLEGRGRRKATSAVRALATLGGGAATVLRDGREEVVPADRVGAGEVVVVRPGERVPVDGDVVSGATAVDRSLVTGESAPEEVAPGAEVVGGSVNTGGGRLEVRATRVGADTALAQIGRLVAAAQAGRAPVQRLVDRVSAVFVPVVIALALLTFLGWLIIGGEAGPAIAASVSVLVISCPCALGLATPAALAAGIGRGAQLGLLIGGPRVLESSRRVTTVLLDKTGTLTRGQPEVAEVLTVPGVAVAEALSLAATAEAGSAHPLARAIVAAAPSPTASVEVFAEAAGVGVSAVVGGAHVEVGAPRSGPLAGRIGELGGATVVELRRDGRQIALIALRDLLRDGSREAVAALERQGARVVLLTGDAPAPARIVAGALGIDEVIAEASPQEKLAQVRRRQDAGEVVAFAGDGINDAAALAAADLGIAIGTGTDVAAAAADITITDGDPRGIADAIGLARRTLRTIHGNLIWAFGYNVAAIPLAVAGALSPLVAAAAMATSSVLVVANSLRLLSAHRSVVPKV